MSEEGRAAFAWQLALHKGQRPPPGGWRTWVFLGGRGAGKTRAGAEWVTDVAARLGPGGRIALVGATMHDVRSVMIEGPSGLMSLPFREPPRLESSRRRVVFPCGAVGVMLSAAEPERFRGPQFHAAWGDEFCAWGKPDEVLALLRLGLRLGAAERANARLAEPRCLSATESAEGGRQEPSSSAASRPLRHGPKGGRATSPSPSGDGEETWVPRLLLTTTPKPLAVLRRVLAEATCVRTDAPTRANVANLAAGFLDEMLDRYGGTRRAAQELEGLVLEAEGALFTLREMEMARTLGQTAPDGFERAVVAVDPPAGTLSGEGGDACGIVVVAKADRVAWVLEDASVRGLSPAGWAQRVARAAREWGEALRCPVRVVAEGNQGGAMVEAVLKGAGLAAPVRRVQATVGKRARAEPVAALYEQGRVGHVGDLRALEEELLGLGEAGPSSGGGASPDRADALVWAVTDLLIDGDRAPPRIRLL